MPLPSIAEKQAQRKALLRALYEAAGGRERFAIAPMQYLVFGSQIGLDQNGTSQTVSFLISEGLLAYKPASQVVSLTHKGVIEVEREALETMPTADDHARFQRMAIDEAKKSISENDGRIHPSVGVVIVKDGHVLASAHRGEIPKGHAEFVALEKKLADVSVVGATVYATLEPCTTRNHPKVPCATRLAERGVARVYIGMLDPNPDIRGLGQQRLSEAGIETQLFPRELMAEVEELNRDFSREQKQRRTSAPNDSKAQKAAEKPPTLSDLFTQDLPNTLKLTNDCTATFADGTTLNMKRQLYLDFAANVKFVGFYIPSSDPLSHVRSFEACLGLVHMVGQTIDDLQKQVAVAAGYRGEMTDAKDLMFSGRTLVYHEAFLSIPQKAAIIEAFAKKQVDVQFRGPDYLGDQVISWHHKHNPKPGH